MSITADEVAQHCCRDQQVEEKRERERRAADGERAADAAMEAERLRALELQLVRGCASQTLCRPLF